MPPTHFADVAGMLLKRRDLEGLIATHNQWLSAFVGIVALGVFGGIIIQLAYARNKPAREMILTLIFGLIVLGGVIGECIEVSRVADEASQLRQMAENDTMALIQRGGTAEIEAQNLRLMNSLLEKEVQHLKAGASLRSGGAR